MLNSTSNKPNHSAAALLAAAALMTCTFAAWGADNSRSVSTESSAGVLVETSAPSTARKPARGATGVKGAVYYPANELGGPRPAAFQPIEVISAREQRVIARSQTDKRGRFDIDLPGDDDYTVIAGAGLNQAYWWGHIKKGARPNITIEFDADFSPEANFE